MFSLLSIILAFFAGILGALIGVTQTFICTGFVGLLIFLLEHVGVDTTFLNEALSNNLFLPCIIFNAAGLATAYAGTKHNIIAGRPTFFKSLIFKDKPALVRITIKANCLNELDIDKISLLIKLKTYGPNIIPVIK